MARVFAKPTYIGELSRLVEQHEGRSVILAGAKHTSKVLSALDAEAEGEFLEPLQVDALYALGEESGPSRATVTELLSIFIKRESVLGKEYYGGEAVDVIYKAIIREGVKDAGKVNLRAITDSAKALSVAGAVGGFGSPGACAARIESIDPSVVQTPDGSRALSFVVLADNIRLGMSSKATNKVWRDLMGSVNSRERLTHRDVEELEVRHSRVKEMVPRLRLFAFGGVSVMIHGQKLCVLTSTDRFNLAACLHTYGMWAVTAALDRSTLGASALTYVHGVLTGHNAPKCWELARYLKSSYALIIAEAQVGTDQALKDTQITGLLQEARSVRPINVKRDFWDVMGSSNEAINYGTVWNVLPPCSIDGAVLADSFKAKCSTVHEADDDAWEEFMVYAKCVMTAHYLVKHPHAEVKWARTSAADSEPEWAQSCREGKLTYYRGVSAGADWIVKSIPWVKVMEGWHHSAADVTHVWSQDDLRVDNELTYALEHAPLLSGMYMPADVRRQWEQGVLPGTRLLYMAGKSENTKFGAKVRETMSADDVTREVLSEIDVNLTTLGKCIEGVTMRAGRAGVEKMIRDVIMHGGDRRVLLSLDVSGWSPNMIRRKELAFIDCMLDMYDIPRNQRISAAFGTPVVHFARNGVEKSFKMVDGSVQGFFGTADTIMHSLVAQWAFSKGKEEKVFDKKAKMRKCVLIDDILCSLDGVTLDMSGAVEFFTAKYKSLGFSVDVVKTLASNNIGTFLNRVYTPKGEILTYAKIAARADREWDRPIVGIIDEVASVFSGYAGAVDRGMNAIDGYYLATLRSLMRVSAITNYKWVLTEGFLALSWFGPNAWGGLGVPNTAEWIAGGGLDGTESKASTMVTVYEMARDGGYQGSAVSKETITRLGGAKVVRRSAAGVWANPSGVKLSGVPDCHGPVRDVIKSAIVQKFQDTELTRLALATPTQAVKGWLNAVLESGAYPAPILATAWASTPYAVANDTMDRYVSCQSLFALVRRDKLRSALASVHRASLKLIGFVNELQHHKKFTGEISASSIHRSLLNSEGVAHHLAGVIQTTAFEFVRQAAPGTFGQIRAFIPACDDISDPPPQPVGARTYCSERAKYMLPAVEVARDPVLGAIRGAVKICGICNETGMDGAYIYDGILSMWGFAGQRAPIGTISCTNYMRLLPGYSKVEHSVRALPNYAPRIRINASEAMARFDLTHRAFDWMTVRCAIQAMCTVDSCAGLPKALHDAGMKELERHYVVSVTADMLRSTPDGSPPAGRCPVSADKNPMVLAYQELLAGGYIVASRADELIDDDEDGKPIVRVITDQLGTIYRICAAPPTRRTAASANPLLFLEALRRDNLVRVRDRNDADVTVPQRPQGSDAIDESTGVVGRWMAKYRHTSPDDFAELVADRGKELGDYLKSFPTGVALWRQLASRNPEACSSAAGVLNSMLKASVGPSNDALKAWRYGAATRYKKKCTQKQYTATQRYRYTVLHHIASRLGDLSHAPTNIQLSGALHALRSGVLAAFGRAFSPSLGRIEDHLNEDEMRVLNGAVPGTVRAIKEVAFRLIAVDVPDDLAAKEELTEGAKLAFVEALNWVMIDSARAENRTEAAVDAARAKASPAPVPTGFAMGDLAAMIRGAVTDVGGAFSSAMEAAGEVHEIVGDKADNDADV